jgi:AcrR family transcriptional regulator
MAGKSKGAATADKILNAAFKCIATRGWGHVALREIAEEAGVALSQLNYYYVNKEGLFAAVLAMMKREYAQGLEVRMAGCHSFTERIAVLAAYNEEILRENPALYKTFLEFFNYSMWSGSFKAEVVHFICGISTAIETQITKDGDEEGPLSKFPPAVVTRLILAASFGLSIQYLLDPADDRVLPGFDAMQSLIGFLSRGDS